MDPQLAESLGYHAAANYQRGMDYSNMSIIEMNIIFDILWEEVYGYLP